MYCPNCGKENPKDNLKCFYCRTPLVPNEKGLSSEQEEVHRIYLQGLNLIKQQKFAEAIEKLDSIIKKDPNHASTWNAKAVVLDKLGDREQALICVENALRIRPNDPKFLSNWHKLKKKVDIAFNEKNLTLQKEKNRCGYCGTIVAMPFTCPYCGGNFCADHRLPFKHNCKNIDEWKFGKKKKKSIKKTLFNQNKNQHQVKRKNPLLAAILSIIYPGLGQIYTNQYFKAIILWLIEIFGIFFGYVPTLLGIIYGGCDAYLKANKINRRVSPAKKINYPKAIGSIITPFILLILISSIIQTTSFSFQNILNSDISSGSDNPTSRTFNDERVIQTSKIPTLVAIPLRTFKSEDYGFSIQYPSHWTNRIISESGKLPKIGFFSLETPENDQIFTVQLHPNVKNKQSLEEYYTQNVARLDAEYDMVITKHSALLKINNIKAYRVDYGIKDYNAKIFRKEIKIFLLNGDYFYDLTYSATPENYDSNLDTAQKMIESLTVFEPNYSDIQLKPDNTYSDRNTALTDYSAAIERKIYLNTNLERQNNGLKPLSNDEKLSEIARSHSQDMITRQFFDHVNPSGDDPTARATRNGYQTRKDMGLYYQVGIGENIDKMPIGNVIGIGYLANNPTEVGEAIVQSWMNSPGHRQNILSDKYDKIGIGVAFDGKTYYYATQDFW